MGRGLIVGFVAFVASPVMVFAHGGCYGDGPPKALPPRAPGRAPAPHASPGDPLHRCAGLRPPVGEVPPSCNEPTGPPPPPPPAGADDPVVARVLDPDGRPMCGAWVWRGSAPLVLTDDEGRVCVAAAGDLRPLVAIVPGCVPIVLRPRDDAGRVAPDVYAVKGATLVCRLVGAPIDDVVARLVPDAPTVPEEWVIATDAAGWSGARASGPERRLRFAGLADGRYRLLARIAGIAGEVTLATGLVPGGGEFDVHVPYPPRPSEWNLRVRLLDPRGEFVAESVIEVVTADGRRKRATGVHGLALVAVIGLGPVSIRASEFVADGAGPQPSAACAHGVVTDADEFTLQLPDPAPLEELALEPPPDARNGAYVRVVDRARGTSTGVLWLAERGLRVPTFADSVLDVYWAPAADLWADARSVGGVLSRLAPGARVALPPVGPVRGEVSGRVVREDGSAVVAARVTVRARGDDGGRVDGAAWEDRRMRREATTDADGRFRVEGVLGPVEIHAAAPGLSNDGAPVFARPGSDVRVLVSEERL